ncbi:glycoside hydrolase family 68 protein [Clostridium estertheticum]|uniref:glycoside hydrolase family 68 protein n=1 Tax=Clostridium estertheticum TaxID=238834 RepID=UPI001C0B17EF|nr:glycoside hydrolase family 68 protein [Clostridium estertheticum]MBU3215041.1 glycoside hydrolase family 68 protein [Clostridium estertheticum]WAG55668.1 glycoside hydrolase family 68 protein [Clostridium estertheticum]
MKKSKIGKIIFSISLISCLIGGGSLTFAKNVSGDYKETYDVSHMTRTDMLKIPKQQSSAQFKVPQFDASTIKNVPSAKGYDKNGNLIDLDVWDSWPLQNADGTVANYHGYHVLFALAGDPKDGSDTFIHLFYQKIGDTSIDSWKSAGRVFKDSDKFVLNDPFLKNQAEEWSGSATLTSDGKVRLFYTDRDSWAPDSEHYGKQTLTTAQVNLSRPDVNTIKIDGVEDLKSIFDGGDGTIYQNVMQGISQNDNHTLRDPHYVEDKGHKYLVFEANTGTKDGYQGDESLFNKAYYGGSKTFFQAEKNKLLLSSKKQIASLANGALGIIELNDDYTLKKVMKPLITSNTITDEIERANVFKMNGKWYLFTDSRGSKMTIDGIGAKDVYMLGYTSNSLTGSYKPLNGSGLVLNMDRDPSDLTFSYSHFAVPQPKGNKVVLTSYITNRGMFADQHATFAPSFLLNIKGSKTSVVPNSILPQGQMTIDTQEQKK